MKSEGSDPFTEARNRFRTTVNAERYKIFDIPKEDQFGYGRETNDSGKN